ncbi:MAG: hypothetical protein ACFFD4_26565 [Candidatus Odinarchaeota archaeon]
MSLWESLSALFVLLILIILLGYILQYFYRVRGRRSAFRVKERETGVVLLSKSYRNVFIAGVLISSSWAISAFFRLLVLQESPETADPGHTSVLAINTIILIIGTLVLTRLPLAAEILVDQNLESCRCYFRKYGTGKTVSLSFAEIKRIELRWGLRTVRGQGRSGATRYYHVQLVTGDNRKYKIEEDLNLESIYFLLEHLTALLGKPVKTFLGKPRVVPPGELSSSFIEEPFKPKKTTAEIPADKRIRIVKLDHEVLIRFKPLPTAVQGIAWLFLLPFASFLLLALVLLLIISSRLPQILMVQLSFELLVDFIVLFAFTSVLLLLSILVAGFMWIFMRHFLADHQLKVTSGRLELKANIVGMDTRPVYIPVPAIKKIQVKSHYYGALHSLQIVLESTVIHLYHHWDKNILIGNLNRIAPIIQQHS